MAKKKTAGKNGASGVALAKCDYLGPPALLAGEDEAAYEALRSKVLAHVKPKDIFEEIYVDDFVNLQWEIMRARRLCATLMNAEKHVSVQAMLTPFRDIDQVRQVYLGCATQDPKAMAKLDDKIKEFGIDLDEIDARTFVRRLDVIERIDRMTMAAEMRRARVLEDLARHREKAATLLKGVIETVEGVAYAEIAPTRTIDTGTKVAAQEDEHDGGEVQGQEQAPQQELGQRIGGGRSG